MIWGACHTTATLLYGTVCAINTEHRAVATRYRYVCATISSLKVSVDRGCDREFSSRKFSRNSQLIWFSFLGNILIWNFEILVSREIVFENLENILKCLLVYIMHSKLNLFRKYHNSHVTHDSCGMSHLFVQTVHNAQFP